MGEHKIRLQKILMNFIFKRNYFNPPSSINLKIYVKDEKKKKKKTYLNKTEVESFLLGYYSSFGTHFSHRKTAKGDWKLNGSLLN